MTERYPKHTRNLITFGIDYVAFGLALGAMNLNTVLPAFAAELGASTRMIGVILTILYLAWGLPQVVAANITARLEKKKPFLLKVVLLSRPVTLAVPIVIFLTQGTPVWLNLLVMLLAFAIFFLTDAFAAVPWFDMLARAFHEDTRGRVMSVWQILTALLMLGISALITFILSDSGPGFPNNYAYLFLTAAILLILSSIGMLGIYEVPDQKGEPETTHIPWKDYGRHILTLWKTDERFRQIVVTRVLFSLSAMAFPFYVLYATDSLQFSEQVIGLFVLATTFGTSVSSFLLGRVADKYGAQRTVQIGSVLMVTMPILAILFTLLNGNVSSVIRYAYVWIYVCMGMGDALVMIGHYNYVFDIATPGHRPIYVGTYGALISIGVLGPVFAGWLVSVTSYQVLFIVSLAAGLIGLIPAFRLIPARDGLLKASNVGSQHEPQSAGG
ncbi:MAG: MFS transporter [Anaerolineae bacterium]|nr:MFS transporter [Anaerolineae bacterium]